MVRLLFGGSLASLWFFKYSAMGEAVIVVVLVLIACGVRARVGAVLVWYGE